VQLVLELELEPGLEPGLELELGPGPALERVPRNQRRGRCR